MRLAIILVVLVLGPLSAAVGQTVTGVVRDSTSRLAVAGAVIELLDSNGASIGRSLTNGFGSFTIPADARGTSLRIVRLGFRPRTLGIAVPTADTLQIAMVRLPTMLDEMRVVAGAKCDQRANDAAQSLLQQARAGLLATIVGREANPAKLVRISYERTYGARLDTMMPTVRLDSIAEARTTFRAGRRGADLVARGFTTDSLGTGVYFGPDAEVLLDEGFEAGYCFYIVPERRGQVGLGFTPATASRIGRVDVDGILWIDTDERALRSLEYRYVGLGREAEEAGVGGSLTYQEMPNGSVIVSRWTLRLLKDRVDARVDRYGRLTAGRIVASEGGGIIARAEWPDGTRWSLPLGKLEVTAVDGESGRRVPGAMVRIRNTNFATVADENGVARFNDVFPGRYVVEVVNRELQALGFVPDTSLANAAALDSAVIRPSIVRADSASLLMTRTVDVAAARTVRHVAPMPTLRQFAARTCRDRRTGDSPRRAILGRVVYGSGRGVDSAMVRADDIKRRVTAGIGGTFVLCIPDDWVGPLKLFAGDGYLRSDDKIVELGDGVTTVRLSLRVSR
jgi:hypothetical protein